MILSAIQDQTSATIPTLWGLDPAQLHDRFWAARGVQVVRNGSLKDIRVGAELYLLIDSRSLVLFSIRRFVELLSWAKPDCLCLRIRNERDPQVLERAATDSEGNFVRFSRSYGGSEARLTRVILTGDPGLARLWQLASDPRTAWKHVRENSSRSRRESRSISARAYDSLEHHELAEFVRDLIARWRHPSSTIDGIRRIAPHVWALSDMKIHPGARFTGPVWLGGGREINRAGVFGPSALWDDPASRLVATGRGWDDIEPGGSPAAAREPASSPGAYAVLKRWFDVAFSLLALLLTLPLFPLVMLAIYLEDGRPFFFGHRRETVGGRSFLCWKFRSMRKDADGMKSALASANQADGPQFFIRSDPRLTRVGRIIRKCNIDELPQFVNVLRGEMSIVGPRPSPRSENQFCPSWREARLSLRPGITGLWQVRRTRAVGLDFQEWIRFDIEYVENMGLRMDAGILARTVVHLIRGVISS